MLTLNHAYISHIAMPTCAQHAIWFPVAMSDAVVDPFAFGQALPCPRAVTGNHQPQPTNPSGNGRRRLGKHMPMAGLARAFLLRN